MTVERPRSRTDGLLVRDLGDEVVVYDVESHRGHSLSRTAALVWRACDGRRTIRAIAAEVGRQLHVPADQDLVRLALQKLRHARLLAPGLQEAATLTRRELARRIGQAALLPVVVSLLVPRPSEAATCPCDYCGDCATEPNTTCWTGTTCGVCLSGICEDV